VNPVTGREMPLVNPQTGLAPGFMAPTPYYNTTNDVQAKYYWGPHPFQDTTTFNAASYNNAPGAPAVGWGQQEQFRPISPEELAQMIMSHTYQQQFQPQQNPSVSYGYGIPPEWLPKTGY
jgi:hypothetical protein